MNVAVPKPKVTDYGRVQYATELAFNELVKQAKESGLDVTPVMGLVYLPTQELTRNFQSACRDILAALTKGTVSIDPS